MSRPADLSVRKGTPRVALNNAPSTADKFRWAATAHDESDKSAVHAKEDDCALDGVDVQEVLVVIGVGAASGLDRCPENAWYLVTGPLTDAEFALIIGPLLFHAVIARRPLTGEFLDELAAAREARTGR
jgi:hypothetical protein